MKIAPLPQVPPSPGYEFGEFRMDVEERVLRRRDGTIIPLTPRVFATLRFFVEHPERVLDKEVLMEAIWPDCIVEENNLAQNISTLRRAFADDAGAPRYIATVPGRGYRFLPEVRMTENGATATATTEPAHPSAEDSAPPTPDRPARRRAGFIAFAVAALVLGLAAFLWWRASTPMPEVAAPERSIAVLPFDNLSSDPENAYFAVGLQDDVLTSLAKIRELKVISRTSTLGYQNPDGRKMREIGHALGVANILEGSVRREGHRILVNVQLIDTRTDLHLWSERYDRTLADSIGLQGELATQIAAALRAQLAPQEKASLATKPTADPEAYALYLQARGREGVVNSSKKDQVAAVLLYTQAITLDPKFALAYARRSIVKSDLGYYAGEETLKAEARMDAETAVRLAPSLAEAHTALGVSLYKNAGDFTGALEQFAIAATTSPNEPETLFKIAAVYRRQGRWSEALAANQRAVDLDPLNREALLRAANCLVYVRDWAAARAIFTRAVQLEPTSAEPQIGLAFLEFFQNNNPAAAGALLQGMTADIDPDGAITAALWDLAMIERNYDLAEKILLDFTTLNFPREEDSPKTFFQGRVALARGDAAAAQRYFTAATPAIEAQVRDHPEDLDWRARLGLLYAYAQRKEDAIREGRRALDSEPESQNAYYGAFRAANLALIYGLVGEAEEAITLLERLLVTPGPVQWPNYPMSITLADLRLRWEWDALRGNPRFQQILAAPEPKTATTASPTQIAPD